MKNLNDYLPKPHPAKAILKSYNLPVSVVARYLNITYGYACNILSGTVRITSENEEKLQQLISVLKEDNHV